MSDRKRASSSLRTSERSRASKAPAFRSTPSQVPSERSRLLHRQQDANTHNDAVGEIVANRAAPSQVDPSQAGPSQQSLPETAVGPEAAAPEVAAGSEADVDPETAAPEAAVGPEATSSEADVDPTLDYQPIDSSIASRFEQCTGENVSGVLIAENPDLLAQGHRGVAIEGRCIDVVPGCLQNVALCTHELTHIVQQRGPKESQTKEKKQSLEDEAIFISKNIAENKNQIIKNKTGEKKLFEEKKETEEKKELEDKNPMAYSAILKLRDYVRRNPNGAGVYAIYEKNYEEKIKKIDEYLQGEYAKYDSFADMPDNIQAITKMLNDLSSVETKIVTCEEKQKELCLQEGRFNRLSNEENMCQSIANSTCKTFEEEENQVSVTGEKTNDVNWSKKGSRTPTVPIIGGYRKGDNKCNLAVAEALLSKKGAGISYIQGGDQKVDGNAFLLGGEISKSEKMWPLDANSYAETDVESKDESSSFGKNPRKCLIRYFLNPETGQIQFESVVIFSGKKGNDKIATYEVNKKDKDLYDANYHTGNGPPVITKDDLHNIIDKSRDAGEILSFLRKDASETEDRESGHMGIHLINGMFISAMTGVIGVNIVSEESFVETNGVQNYSHSLSRTYITKK